MNEDIIKKIRERTERFKKIKTFTDKDLTPRKLIMMFVESVQDLNKCKDAIEYKSNLDSLCMILDGKMKTFDSLVRMEIRWNNSSEEKDFKRLQVSGVRISWSDSYLKKYSNKDKMEIIDVADVLLED